MGWNCLTSGWCRGKPTAHLNVEGKDADVTMQTLLMLVVVVSLLPMFIMAIMAMKWSRASRPPSVQRENALYADHLIEIWPDYIVFFNYYIFSMHRNKCVRVDEIERIWTKPCTLRTGKWRIHGSGDFRTWFPQDNHRPKRDRIFFADLSTQGTRIGFTVERPEEVEKVLKGKGLFKTKVE